MHIAFVVLVCGSILGARHLELGHLWWFLVWISDLTFVGQVFCSLVTVTSPGKLWASRMMLAFQSWGHSGCTLQLIPDQKF